MRFISRQSLGSLGAGTQILINIDNTANRNYTENINNDEQ